MLRVVCACRPLTRRAQELEAANPQPRGGGASSCRARCPPRTHADSAPAAGVAAFLLQLLVVLLAAVWAASAWGVLALAHDAQRAAATVALLLAAASVLSGGRALRA